MFGLPGGRVRGIALKHGIAAVGSERRCGVAGSRSGLSRYATKRGYSRDWISSPALLRFIKQDQREGGREGGPKWM